MRSWPGLAAVGAALIHLGIAAGAPVWLLVPFVLAGGAEAVWAVAALARVALPAPRGALIAVAVIVAGQVALLVAGHHGVHGTVPMAAVGGASALDLGLAALLAGDLRRPSARAREEHPMRSLGAVAGGAAVVAAVVVTSLSSTPIGVSHAH